MNQLLQDRKLGSTENNKVTATGGRMSGCGVQPLLTLSWSISLPTCLVNQVNSSRRQKSHEVSFFFSFLSVEDHLAQGSSQLPSLGRGDRGRVCTRTSIFYRCIELSELGIL